MAILASLDTYITYNNLLTKAGYFYPDLSFAIIIFSLVFLITLVGSISDFRTREVADWINYGLIISAFFIRLIYSIYSSSFQPIIYGVLGFLIGLGLAMMMFYLGQWGGGDSKMLIGLSALFGFSFNIEKLSALNFTHLLFDNLLLVFLLDIFIAGCFYGLAWSIMIAFNNYNLFSQTYTKIASQKKHRIARIILIILIVIVILSTFMIDDILIRYFSFAFAALVLLGYYLFLFVKALEQSCMIKNVDVESLTEGDWIPKDIFVDEKYIAGPKDLGISMPQIKKLIRLKSQKKIDKVLIKVGIPFIPSFFLAFILLMIFGNWLILFI